MSHAWEHGDSWITRMERLSDSDTVGNDYEIGPTCSELMGMARVVMPAGIYWRPQPRRRPGHCWTAAARWDWCLLSQQAVHMWPVPKEARRRSRTHWSSGGSNWTWPCSCSFINPTLTFPMLYNTCVCVCVFPDGHVLWPQSSDSSSFTNFSSNTVKMTPRGNQKWVFKMSFEETLLCYICATGTTTSQQHCQRDCPTCSWQLVIDYICNNLPQRFKKQYRGMKHQPLCCCALAHTRQWEKVGRKTPPCQTTHISVNLKKQKYPCNDHDYLHVCEFDCVEIIFCCFVFSHHSCESSSFYLYLWISIAVV